MFPTAYSGTLVEIGGFHGIAPFFVRYAKRSSGGTGGDGAAALKYLEDEAFRTRAKPSERREESEEEAAILFVISEDR